MTCGGFRKDRVFEGGKCGALYHTPYEFETHREDTVSPGGTSGGRARLWRQ